MARGADRKNSPYHASLQPFALSELIIYMKKGRDVQTLGACTLIDYFRRVREHAALLCAAETGLEIIRKTVHPGEPIPRLFDLLKAYLQRLDTLGNTGEDLAEKLIWMFILHFLRIMGYAPAFGSCLKCGTRKLPPSVLLSPAAGGVFCETCGRDAAGGRWVPHPLVHGLDILASSKFDDVRDLALADRLAVRGVLTDLLSVHFEKNMHLECLDYYFKS
jgi:DNA repair protein RecO (recombination protein O)